MSKLMQDKYVFNETELKLIEQIEQAQEQQVMETGDNVVLPKKLYEDMKSGIGSYKRLIGRFETVYPRREEKVTYYCPCCENDLTEDEPKNLEDRTFCRGCGQAISWEVLEGC